MSMYGFHTALSLLREMQDRIINNPRMSSSEKEFQCKSLDALIELVQANYHMALHKDLGVKTADEMEHEAEQMCARLEAAFGTESEEGKWN